MFLALFIAILLGILAGTISGLSPGIHINLIAAIMLGLSPLLLGLTSPIILVVFIVSMSMTHTFVDYVPSIYLGAPDQDSILSVLPGHKLLLKGHAHEAVFLTALGGLFALIVISVFTPIFIYLLPIVYPYIIQIMPLVLILISGFLVFSEKEKRLWALVIFIFSGFLGIASLNLNLNEPLLPLLSGLFGASNLFISLFQKTKIPKQKIISFKRIIKRKKYFLKPCFASIIASPFTSFLPGLGSSQAAVIGKEVVPELNKKEFLFLLGAINTIVMGLSFITLYSINKTRTGSAVAVQKLIPNLTLMNLETIFFTIFVSGIIAFFITITISKNISEIIDKINYSRLSLVILCILTFFVFLFSGFLGLLVFFISTSLGLTAISVGVKRIHLMGCLLIPTILFYIL
jgi:putative membrane protein